MTETRAIEVIRLGRVSYPDATDRMEIRARSRLAGRVPDALFLLEHQPTVTLGRRGTRAHILATEEDLEKTGIHVFETGRGGDVTYHGPGQLVAYPVLDLSPDRKDVRKYVRDLESVMLRTAAFFGVAAKRDPKRPGAWVEDRKIGSVGVRISRWVTTHGFAFNVTTSMAPFQHIVPCGIEGCTMTSLRLESERPVTLDSVYDVVETQFMEVFGGRALEPTDLD